MLGRETPEEQLEQDLLAGKIDSADHPLTPEEIEELGAEAEAAEIIADNEK